VNKRTATATLALICIVGAAMAERMSIDIFSYVSVDSPDQGGLVQSLLRQKIINLAGEMRRANKEVGELENLRVNLRNAALPDLGDLVQYWKSTHALEILSGAIVTDKPDKPRVLTSNVYLGDLQGSLSKSTISVVIELTPEEYTSWRDMHVALTLYALAMDAKTRRPLPRGIVSQYLAEAESQLKSIQQQATLRSRQDVLALAEAVKKELTALKASSEP
jgi:hypothetical protein